MNQCTIEQIWMETGRRLWLSGGGREETGFDRTLPGGLFGAQSRYKLFGVQQVII